MNRELIISKVELDRKKVKDFNKYPFNIEIIKNFKQTEFKKNVTFLIGENGLYILDEPEAALSPTRQMSLLCLIDELAKKGSQFIISTHSPILISYRDGEILDLNDDFNTIKYEDTDIYRIYKSYLDDPYQMQKRLFDEYS